MPYRERGRCHPGGGAGRCARTYSDRAVQAARPTGAGEFSSEAQAKARCPGDTVVWVNTKGKSHTYHYAGSRWYGTTKQGAYMCEADAGAAGYHASKSKTEQQKPM
jgi:plastocyanin